MKIRDVATVIEEFAPLQLQETYDNSGLNIGFPDAELTGVLICVDVTETVVDEAIGHRANITRCCSTRYAGSSGPTLRNGSPRAA